MGRLFQRHGTKVISGYKPQLYITVIREMPFLHVTLVREFPKLRCPALKPKTIVYCRRIMGAEAALKSAIGRR